MIVRLCICRLVHIFVTTYCIFFVRRRMHMSNRLNAASGGPLNVPDTDGNAPDKMNIL